MNIVEIISSLNEIYNKPLKDGEERKIVYWIDVEKDYVGRIDEINIPNVKKHILEKDNYFYTKYLLEEEDSSSNYLIYTNEELGEDVDNWLLDNMLYSETYYVDRVSLIMKDLNIPTEWRSVVSKNIKFFDTKSNYQRFKDYEITNYSDIEIELAMISALAKQKSVNFEESLRAILIDSLEDESNKILSRIDKHFNLNRFWHYVEHFYGFKQEEKNLKKLMIHLMITRLSQNLAYKDLAPYKEFISESNRGNCYIFLDRWMNHRVDAPYYNEYAREIEKEININKLIETVDIEDIKQVEVFPIVDKSIINYILVSLENRLEDYEEYLKLIRLRESKHFYEEYKEFYEGLYYAVKMFQFKKENSQISIEKPSQMFRSYTEKYYLMDFYYRKFYISFDNKNDNEVMQRLRTLVENLYTNWYMVELSYNWTQALSLNKTEFWNIDSIIRQGEFYNDFINKKIQDGERVYVIISDALRYEIAMELKKKLIFESLGEPEITSILGGLPTNTKMGMARLLPHKNIELKGNGQVYVDKMATNSTVGRDYILKSKVENSLAIDSKEFMLKKPAELLEIARNNSLIYIYHDSIDALGDDASSEIYAFDGAEKAIEEINKIVTMIERTRLVSNIYITSDHGFIYQRDPLEEVDKLSKEKIDSIESKRRYIISSEDRDIDSMLKYSLKDTLGENSNLNVYVPKANIRLKTQGPGANFVHGGAALQEIVVPVLFYRTKGSSTSNVKKAEKTKIKLTTISRSITNSIFTLDFFQTEKVGGKIISVKVNVYMVDDKDNIISNQQTLLGDKVSENPEDRNMSINFILQPKDYDRNKNYYLIIKDNDTGVVYDKIQFSISLGISNDFGF